MPTISTHLKNALLTVAAAVALGLCAAPTAGAASIKIAAAGDISCPADSTALNAIDPEGPQPHKAAAKCQGRRVAEMIQAENPRFTIATGDLIQGQPSFRRAYDDFDFAWASILGDRIVSTPGNHDYHRNAAGRLTASGYFDYWEDKRARPWRYGKPDLGWSSWNMGSWHMINLNSNCNITDCTFTGRQLRWLINDLKRDRANPQTKCTLAYMHHPMFSEGAERGRSGEQTLVANMWELLYRFRADLVVTGHQHYYERYRPQNPSGKFDPTGLTQYITGTGGASTFRPDGRDGRVPENSVRAVRSLGATFLRLGDGGFRSYFKELLSGKVRDKTEVTPCNKPNAGHEDRRPRSERYARHMERMNKLERRIRTETRRIKKLRKREASNRRVNRVDRRLSRVEAQRDRLKNRKLFG